MGTPSLKVSQQDTTIIQQSSGRRAFMVKPEEYNCGFNPIAG
ncbi:MAG: hypothetical protein QXG39_09170 [Candidatus Aenigmatarchaeota archaeon]